MTPSPRIAVATPHQEASMLAIARATARKGHLARMYTTLHTARVEAAVPKLPHAGLRRALEGQLARRSFAGIPSDVVEPVAQVPGQLSDRAAMLGPAPERSVADDQ